jgi:hypothetical protein
MYRQIYTGELRNEKVLDFRPKYVFRSKSYQLDMNNDGFFESIQIAKKDNLDFIEIYDFEGNRIFNERLFAYGGQANLYKIRKFNLSKNVLGYILYFFEGVTKSVRFEGTARLYFITVENKDLSTMSMYVGPAYWHEKEKIRNQYWQRDYKIHLVDYNKDGTKEVSVSFNHINKVYFYKGGGRWRAF